MRTMTLILLAACGTPSTTTPPEPSRPPSTTPAPSTPPAPTTAPEPSPSTAPSTAPEPSPSTAPEPATPAHTVLLIPGTTITGDYFDQMAERLRQDGFSPVVYEDPDLLTGSLAQGAAGIGAAVDRVLAQSGESRLSIVAECDGGVATRYWLQVLGGASKVDQVVTFVSAHHGTWESPLGSWIPGMQALADVTPGSDFLQTLNATSLPPGTRFTSIYSCWDEFMVPYTTSIVDGATNVLFCQYKIGHFDGFWDAVVYQRILAALKGVAAPNEY